MKPRNALPQAVQRGNDGRWRLSRSSSTKPRRALVLILVMVVVALLTLGGLTFSELMLNEHRATVLVVHQAQARAAADSAIEAVRYFLALPIDVQHEMGGWYNNEQQFRGVLLRDDEDPRGRSRFSIVAPTADDGSGFAGIRYGIEDESTKLNLNALAAIEKKTPGAGRDLLLALPGMSEDIADAILDWMDADDEPREFGAEVDYYLGLDPPYVPKNGPLETIEELLLVRGVTPALLFGADADRNGFVDSDQSLIAAEGVDNSDGRLDRGWAGYLTLCSLESNTRPDGSAKIDVNQTDMQKLYDELVEALGNEDWAAFIVAYRQNGPYTGTRPGELISGKTPDLKQKGIVKLSTILDLIGARVQARFPGERQAVVLEPVFPEVPGVMNVYLPLLMDNLTVNPQKVIPGRININQAPRAVLEGIPGMTGKLLDTILSQREVDPVARDPGRDYETWLLTEGLVSLDEMKTLMPFVCAGGSVFRIQAVGYFDGGGPSARIEAIIDTTESKPKLIFWRDLTHLGRGFSLETLGVGGF